MIALLLFALPLVSATSYPLVESWKGDTFVCVESRREMVADRQGWLQL